MTELRFITLSVMRLPEYLLGHQIEEFFACHLYSKQTLCCPSISFHQMKTFRCKSVLYSSGSQTMVLVPFVAL